MIGTIIILHCNTILKYEFQELYELPILILIIEFRNLYTVLKRDSNES